MFKLTHKKGDIKKIGGSTYLEWPSLGKTKSSFLMAKRTYNRRGRQTAKTPITSSKRRPQRIKGAQTARRTGSRDKMTVSGQRNIKGGPRGAQGPANPPVQGPSRRTPTAMGGDTGRRGGPNQPARSGPPRPAGPKAGVLAVKCGLLQAWHAGQPSI